VNEYSEDYLCECSGVCPCNERIRLISSEAEKVFQRDDRDELWIISNDCPNGPDPSYTLVEKREGYSLYREEPRNSGDKPTRT